VAPNLDANPKNEGLTPSSRSKPFLCAFGITMNEKLGHRELNGFGTKT